MRRSFCFPGGGFAIESHGHEGTAYLVPVDDALSSSWSDTLIRERLPPGKRLSTYVRLMGPTVSMSWINETRGM